MSVEEIYIMYFVTWMERSSVAICLHLRRPATPCHIVLHLQFAADFFAYYRAPQPNSYLFPFLPAPPTPPPIPLVVEASAGAGAGGEMEGMGQQKRRPLVVMASPPGADPNALASFKQAQALAGGPLVQARNFAVMTGANAGISCVMRRIRGVEDVQGSMAAAFGSGALFSIVSGMGSPNPVANAITTGVAFAVFQGGFFMIGQKFSQPPSEDIYYSRGRNMLKQLGLQNYEKNFKKGLLTDQTLPLLNDSALRDVKIPPGPRLLILDHIQRDPELTKST